MGPLIPRSEHPKAIQFCTVAGFKGLEADAVLSSMPRLGNPERAETIYVGMSRRGALLAVMRPAGLDPAWEELQEDFGAAPARDAHSIGSSRST